MQLSLSDVWPQVAPELKRLVRAMRLDYATCDDVLQDVYLQAMQKCPPGVDVESLRRWLYRVTVNRCNLEYRRAASERTLHAGWTRHRAGSEVTNGGSGQAERNETIEVVRRHLSGLPPPLHALVVLRYFAELDSKEIGAILEIPHSTVRSPESVEVTEDRQAAFDSAPDVRKETRENLKLRGYTLQVDIAGARARIEAINELLAQREKFSARRVDQLEELKIAAEVELAGLSAEERSLMQLIELLEKVSRQLRGAIIEQSKARNQVDGLERQLQHQAAAFELVAPLSVVDDTITIQPLEWTNE